MRMKLNIGSGAEDRHLPGYENWDRKNGREAYPLDVADGSLWELRASHVLEHFSHRDVPAVVKNWCDKLLPGGCLKIAVPNFQVIATEYLHNQAENPRGYIMGGHDDEDDKHGTIFDRGDLYDLMRKNKLERIGPWESEIKDCASHRYSLNLQGFKPSLEGVTRIPRGEVRAAEALPRFGPLAHHTIGHRVLDILGIDREIGNGCFWYQHMCEGMERAIARDTTKYVLTLDYDTLFSTSDVMELYRLMEAFPEADAIASIQSKRESNCALFLHPDKDGRPIDIPEAELDKPLSRIYLAHFGLTIFRASTLRKFARPWMLPEPNKEGRWTDGKVDADISFWHRWNEQGYALYLANRVVVGHMSELVEWPGPDFRTVYQPLSDYEKNGIPAAVVR